MPNISYKQLNSYLKTLKKNNKSDDATFQLLLRQFEMLGSLIHDNHKLTTQDERQDIYGDIKEYIDAYDKAFGGIPKNVKFGKELDNINAIGDRLSKKLSALGNKPENAAQFKANTDDVVTNIGNNSKAMHDGVLLADIDRYTNNTYYAIQRAQQLAKEKKLDPQTAELMNQLNANLLAVTNNGVLSLEDKHAAARSISHIVVFYNDNLFEYASRSKINSAEPIAPLARDVGDLIAENKAAVENLRKVNPNGAENLERIVNQTSQALQDDLNAITAMASANKWADWEYRDQMYRREEEKKMEQEIQDQGLKNEEQLRFQQVVDSNPEYKEVPYLTNMIAILGIDENELPETMTYTSVTGKQITRNMREELRNLKRLAVEAATLSAERYDPENKENHLMSDADMENMFDKLTEFENAASRFVRPLKVNKTAEIIQATVDEAVNAVSQTTLALHQTRKYIENYGGDSISKDTKLFSLYELQGRMNPDAHAGFLRHVDEFKRRGAEIYNKSIGKDGKPYVTAANAYNTVKEPLRKLTEEILPGVFKHEAEMGGDTVNPVKPEQIKALYEGYKDVFLKANEFIHDYDAKLNSKKAKFADGEKEFYESMKAVSSRAAGKFLLLGYLSGEENSLADDIKRYNDTPEDKRSKVDNAAFYEYAMSCKEHLKNNTLLPQYLFEDHKAPRVGHILSMMNAKKDIDAADKLERNAAKITWNKGKRKLDGLKEYDLFKKQTGINDNIYQFATHMDHDNFMDVFNKSMRNLPPELEEIELTDADTNEKVKINVKDFMLKAVNEQILYRKDQQGNLKPADPSNNMNFYNTQDGENGFFVPFRKFKDLDPELSKFIKQLNRNLYNAGFCEDAQMTKVPKGYNEGHARSFAYELSYNKGAEGLLPVAKMEKKATLPLAGGKAKFDQISNIQIGEMEPNFNVTSKQSQHDDIYRPSFYTTTKNFRSSDFVGEIGGNARNDVVNNDFLKGKSEDEIKTFLEQRKKALEERMKKGTYKAFTSASVRDYNSFNKPEVLKNAADLQIMDYIMGVKKRVPDDIRIRFQIDSKKVNNKGNYYPEVQGIGGAFTDDMPFARELKDNNKLTNPEDMLVITERMESDLRRWAKGEFYPDEKEKFEKLPKESRDDFNFRVKAVLLQVDLSKDHDFKDIKDEQGKVVPGGFKFERGFIRVVTDEEFKNIHIDDLSIARNQAGFKNRDKVKPINIFDTVAAMPKACHEALKDKTNAQFLGSKSDIRGEDVSGSFLVDNTRSDEAFYKMELERALYRSRTLLTDANEMDKDRSQEYGWHKNIGGDSLEYMKVMESAAEIDDWATKLPILMQEEKKYLANRQAYAQQNRDLAEIIREERRARLEFSQQLAREKGLPVPTKLPPPSDDPNFYFSLQKKNEKLRHRIENYLTSRNKPSTEFGKMRQRRMVDIYNKLNRQMEEYAFYTGITTYPPRKCSIDNNFSVKFENVYEDRYTFETEGVKPSLAKKFVSEFKKVNKANEHNGEQYNITVSLKMAENPRYQQLCKKKLAHEQSPEKPALTAEEKEELKKLTFNKARDGKTGYTVEEIGKKETKYRDPNSKSGRSANPKFDTVFKKLRGIMIPKTPLEEQLNNQPKQTNVIGK